MRRDESGKGDFLLPGVVDEGQGVRLGTALGLQLDSDTFTTIITNPWPRLFPGRFTVIFPTE